MAGKHTNDPEAAAETVLLQVRLPRDLVRRLDHFCIDHDVFRAAGCWMLLESGLKRIAERESSNCPHREYLDGERCCMCDPEPLP